MSTITNLETLVQNRLEEVADDTGIFWNVANELRPLIVEAMNLACLITGEPQVLQSSPVTISSSTSFAPISMPAGALALVRVVPVSTGVPLPRVWIQDLDRHNPGWEVATGSLPRYYFPFGLSQFGIYPNQTAPIQVTLSYVAFPVAELRPYTGSEVIPFQTEYNSGIEDWAAAAARFKEAGPEFDQAMLYLNRALLRFQELSSFAYRKDSLRFTRAAGMTSNISEVRVR